jgi:hypothetical protein
MVAIFVALGVTLVAGLVLIPVLEEAQAISSTALSKRYGQNGELKSNGRRQGGGINL